MFVWILPILWLPSAHSHLFRTFPSLFGLVPSSLWSVLNVIPSLSALQLLYTGLVYSTLSCLSYCIQGLSWISLGRWFLGCSCNPHKHHFEVFQSWRQNEHIWLEMIQYCSSMSNLWRNEPDMIYMNSEMLNRYIQVQRDWEKVLTVMGICYIRVLFQTFYC